MDSGDWLLVAWMIEHDADLNATDDIGWTPLLRIGSLIDIVREVL